MKALENPALHQVCFYDLRPSPFFFQLSSNVFPDIELVGRIEKKKLQKVSEYPGIIALERGNDET